MDIIHGVLFDELGTYVIVESGNGALAWVDVERSGTLDGMEPAASSSSDVAAARHDSLIPVTVVRMPRFHLVIGALCVFIGAVELLRLDPSSGFREWLSAGWWILFGSYFLLSYLTHSVTVTREIMVLRRWFDVEAIRTDDFVSIERNGSWISRSDTVVTKHGSLRAPWYHPNLSAALRTAINGVRPLHEPRGRLQRDNHNP